MKFLCPTLVRSSFAAAILTAGPAALACDSPSAGVTPHVVRGVVIRSTVVTDDPCLPQASAQHIRAIGVQLVTLVNVCQDDAEAAAAAMKAAESSLAKTLQSQDDTLARMVLLRDLLAACGSHVCIGEKIFSKEEVASVLSLKLNAHQSLVKLESDQRQKLAVVQQHHRQMVERLAKWQRQQDELVTRVDAVRKSQQARRSSLEEHANSEVISRVLELTSSLESQFESMPDTNKNRAVGVSEGQVAAKQAAAEFDRLFGTSVAR